MNKPVAWISRLPEGDVYNCAWAEKQNDDDIPLYTHPVKELTINDFKNQDGFIVHADGNIFIRSIDDLNATLRKAQEK